jgi:hypothetical protein
VVGRNAVKRVDCLRGITAHMNPVGNHGSQPIPARGPAIGLTDRTSFLLITHNISDMRIGNLKVQAP